MRILLAFLSPISHALSNIVDNHLSNHWFKNTWTLIFYGSCVSLLFLPLVFLVEVPDLTPPLALFPCFIVLALIEVGYLYPYYKALQYEDTSIVTSLFSLGKIFVPLLAFVMVGEVLSLTQYLGFALIIVCGALLTWKRWVPLHLNKGFIYMLVVSFILSLEAVLYKYTFETVSWSTSFVWTTIIAFLLTFVISLLPIFRHDIVTTIPTFIRWLPTLLLNGFLDFVGNAAAIYVIALVPVTLMESISETQPLFVLLFALVLRRFLPHIFKEHIDRRTVIKKVVLFLFIIVGVVITIW